MGRYSIFIIAFDQILSCPCNPLRTHAVSYIPRPYFILYFELVSGLGWAYICDAPASRSPAVSGQLAALGQHWLGTRAELHMAHPLLPQALACSCSGQRGSQSSVSGDPTQSVPSLACSVFPGHAPEHIQAPSCPRETQGGIISPPHYTQKKAYTTGPTVLLGRLL